MAVRFDAGGDLPRGRRVSGKAEAVIPVNASMRMSLVAGESTTGLWCPRCLKPSGVETAVKGLSAESGVWDIGAVRRCYDCGDTLSQN